MAGDAVVDPKVSDASREAESGAGRPGQAEGRKEHEGADSFGEVNRLIKSLQMIPGGFAPKSEQEFDDVLESWTQQAVSFGHEVHC